MGGESVERHKICDLLRLGVFNDISVNDFISWEKEVTDIFLREVRIQLELVKISLY